jgi:hypothetical protein
LVVVALEMEPDLGHVVFRKSERSQKVLAQDITGVDGSMCFHGGGYYAKVRMFFGVRLMKQTCAFSGYIGSRYHTVCNKGISEFPHFSIVV